MDFKRGRAFRAFVCTQKRSARDAHTQDAGSSYRERDARDDDRHQQRSCRRQPAATNDASTCEYMRAYRWRNGAGKWLV